MAENPAKPASVPLPPPEADVHTTCCEYCPVACGYKVYTWPVGQQGGAAADENALGVDFPNVALSGTWISENMHNVVQVNGRALECGHRSRWRQRGRQCRRNPQRAWRPTRTKGLYVGRTDGRSPEAPDAARRRDAGADPVGMAMDLVADLSSYVIDTWDELAWGMKIYSYQYYENVYAGSKLALGAIGTPNYSPHHAPADGDDVPGLSDCGIDAFAAAFADDKAADVLMIVGSDPYETKTVRFTTWQVPGGAPIIYVDPAAHVHRGLRRGARRAASAARTRHRHVPHARDRSRDHQPGMGGQRLHQQLRRGRDELDQEGKWRRQTVRTVLRGVSRLPRWSRRLHLESAERITGVPADKIRAPPPCCRAAVPPGQRR